MAYKKNPTPEQVTAAMNAYAPNLIDDVLQAEIDAALAIVRKPSVVAQTTPVHAPQPKPVCAIGVESLDLDVSGLDDSDLLEKARERFPQGVLLSSGDIGPVWVHPRVLAGSAHLDGFGIETLGLVATACDLIRLACDASMAQEFGDPAARKLLKSFVRQAHDRSISKKTNQLHAVRFGVSAKVVLADRVEPGVIEVHPDGAVAQRLFEAARAACAFDHIDEPEVADLEFVYVLIERHPFVLPYVACIRFNRNLTRSLVLANRMEFRGVNRGDADGDTLNMYVVPSIEMATAMQVELRAAVAGVCGGRVLDAALAIRGVAITADSDTWAENIFEDGKTVEKKMTQTFVKTSDEWLSAHIKMADMANKFTPFAYRISDIGAAMAGLGLEDARVVSLMGAVIEEDFYLGLTGGPSGLDEAMETWFREKSTQKSRKVVLDGIRKVVRPDLLTTDVKITLFEAARINQNKLDLANPLDVFTHFAFLVGKGKSSLGANRAPAIREVLAGINAIADTDEVKGASQRFLVQMGVHAAATLGMILDAKQAAPDDDDDWEAPARNQDEDLASYSW